MSSTTLFYIFIAILIFDFIKDKWLDYLNAQHFNDKVPKLIEDVYSKSKYEKSQAYKLANYKFSTLTSIVTFSIIILFLFFDGFYYVDSFVRKFSNNEIIITLLFFGILFIANEIISTPFAYYQTFVIEEKFGFNKSTKKLFFIDKLKGLLLTALIGGGLLAIIVWFYLKTGIHFWIYTWALISVFSLFITMFYSTLLVPLFNKQTPLEAGELKDNLMKFAAKVGFKLDKIFVIDGSKRSTKANAYFSGFGPKKRIVLYDTLIKDLTTDEIIAVLAHEVGHYKRKHVLFNILLSVILAGITLFLLSLLISNPLLSNALSVKISSFHIGLIAFSLLYSPISEITGLITNIISRKFEYQADNFAKNNFNPSSLVLALKKLSSKSLSNLTPDKYYVFVHYSHPTLLQRIKNLNS